MKAIRCVKGRVLPICRKLLLPSRLMYFYSSVLYPPRVVPALSPALCLCRLQTSKEKAG